MKITLRLIAIKHLDESAAPDGVRELDFDGPLSLQQVLDANDLPKDTYMTLVNDKAVAIQDRGATMIHDGDSITVFPPIQGG